MRGFFAFLHRRSAAIIGVLFSLTLVPMLVVSAYDYPMGDDFRFSQNVHDVLMGGGSFWAVLQAAGRMVAATYVSWQGTYSAIFVMSLQPGAFADWAYRLVPFIMLGLLVLATLKLLDTILCVCLGEKKRMVALIGLPVLFLSIQYLPSATEGFYWFNGASYYTLFYSVMLLYIDALILFIRGGGKLRPAARFGIAALLAAILGGANFVTALLTLLAGFIALACCFFKRRGRLLPTAFLQAVALAGFLISVLAPGNAVRQARYKGMSLPMTLIYSLGQAGGDIFLWGIRAVAVFILLAPLIYRIAGRSGLRFRLSGVFLILTLLLFAAQNAPPYYAMSWGGENRLRDIVYYSFIWLVLVNLFYFFGWCGKRHPEFAAGWRALKRRLGLRDGSRAVACCAAVLFLIATFNPLALRSTSSWVSARALLSGEAGSYGRQMDARLALYEDKSVSDVVVPALTARPAPVFFEDISGSQDAMNNRDVAAYYNKASVTAAK